MSFPPLQNDTFLRACRREPTEYTPIWVMRQAGRYLPEYRQVRAKAGDFMTLAQTPELACEVTLQPINRFDLDASIIFSDILTIPDAMGLGLHFVEGEGPKFHRPISHPDDVAKLGVPDPNTDLRYVMDAITMTRNALGGRVPLIGFAGSPWTLATYMVEGGPSKQFNKVKGMLYDAPVCLHQLLATLTESVTQYLLAQVEAGAQALMIFDSWGGILSTSSYQAFSLHYMKKIVLDLKADPRLKDIPIILFTKQGNLWLESIADSGCDVVGLDWTIDMADAKRRIGDRVALQGNLDPSILAASPEVIVREAKRVLASYGGGEGHIFNLGHGITPDIPPEHLAALIAAVHDNSACGKASASLQSQIINKTQ